MAFSRQGEDMKREVLPTLVRSDGSILPLADIEILAIHYAIRTLGSPTRAASALGIGRSTLYKKLEEPRVKVLCEHRPIGVSRLKKLIKSMQGETLETIQWVVEVRFGERRSLGEIAHILMQG
jgi:hypothetical protein